MSDHIKSHGGYKRVLKSSLKDLSKDNVEGLIKYEETKLRNGIGLAIGQNYVRITRMEDREFVTVKGIAHVLAYPTAEQFSVTE